jgi:hypothetical protein
MSETQRVKVGDSCVINLLTITNVLLLKDGRVVIAFSGDDVLTLASGAEAEAFWKFYSSYLYGCLDVGELFSRPPQITLTGEVENYGKAF